MAKITRPGFEELFSAKRYLNFIGSVSNQNDGIVDKD